jgi:hypothetical protein
MRAEKGEFDEFRRMSARVRLLQEETADYRISAERAVAFGAGYAATSLES